MKSKCRGSYNDTTMCCAVSAPGASAKKIVCSVAFTAGHACESSFRANSAPAVALRLLLVSLTAVIEWPGIDLWH